MLVILGSIYAQDDLLEMQDTALILTICLFKEKRMVGNILVEEECVGKKTEESENVLHEHTTFSTDVYVVKHLKDSILVCVKEITHICKMCQICIRCAI